MILKGDFVRSIDKLQHRINYKRPQFDDVMNARVGMGYAKLSYISYPKELFSSCPMKYKYTHKYIRYP